MSTDHAATSGSDDSRGPRLYAVVEEYDDERDECTIFPATGQDFDRLTAWISAKKPDYVSLGEVR